MYPKNYNVPNYNPMPNNPNMPNYNYPNRPVNPNIPKPDMEDREPLPVFKDQEYLQGYLMNLIGEYVRIDFLIGTNTFLDKEGRLLDVGVDYVVLQEAETDDYIIGDLYSIKFVKVLR
ncbi:hypothetical protein [Senegalia massiliensis]|uniref:Uncharacterized protein n=1 Tax=Senegalia massiliensis TaxID=1720316 RepID=A0A845QUV5_9CLOT|nr:hypothetical protein [Senegalia massiliensis]NBI05820.1 hypothetical protein [Senegalia massiliensis]